MKVKTLKKVPYISQLQQTDCGLCCCAMILRYYKSKESLLELREFLEVGRDGLTIKQLSTLFQKKGFETKLFTGSLEGIKGLNMPIIVYWKNEHFVVVEKINKGKVIIIDPSVGRKVLSEEEFTKNFTKYILHIVPTENFIPQKKKMENVWLDILRKVLERKLLFIFTLLLSFSSYLITLRIPIVIQQLIDNIIKTKSTNSIRNFIYVCIIIAMLFGGLILLRGVKFISINLFLNRRLSANTFSHLLHLPFKFFDLRPTGDLLFRISCLNGVRELLSTQLVGGIIDIGAIIFITGYMILKSLILALVAIAIFIGNMIFMFLTRQAIAESINNEIIEQSKSQSIQVEALFSIASIKTSGMETEIYNTWEKSFEDVMRCFKRRSILQNIFNTVTEIVHTVAPLIILIIGLLLYIAQKLTLGEVIAFQSLSITFFGLSTSVFGAYTQYILATSYLERVADITYSECEKKPKNPVNIKISGEIRLENVSFSYTRHSSEVIKNISLHIKKGQKVAIVGASGSGKSTLSKILVGLYNPTKGRVFYDNISMERFDKTELCKQMGIVPQNTTLFNKSILKNIILNREDVDIEKVKKVAKAAQIADEIESMPMGYNTIVSEMGLNLSGGQRQRIVLARALLNNPKILILDEATSSLDMVNESKISDYLSNIGCTRIIIAHRLSTIIDSDLICVMDEGEIVEKGTHDELMEKKGIYYYLYNTAEEGVQKISI